MSSSFINYLDYRTEGTFSKFADDTKLGRAVKYSGEQASIQKDLSKQIPELGWDSPINKTQDRND